MIDRVRDRATFDTLRREGRRARHGVVTVTFVPDDAPAVRAAYAVSRKVGNAVVRNRVRRRLRSILRELDRPEGAGEGSPLAPGAYLVSVRPEAATRPYHRLREDMVAACTRVTRVATPKDGAR